MLRYYSDLVIQASEATRKVTDVNKNEVNGMDEEVKMEAGKDPAKKDEIKSVRDVSKEDVESGQFPTKKNNIQFNLRVAGGDEWIKFLISCYANYQI